MSWPQRTPRSSWTQEVWPRWGTLVHEVVGTQEGQRGLWPRRRVFSAGGGAGMKSGSEGRRLCAGRIRVLSCELGFSKLE